MHAHLCQQRGCTQLRRLQSIPVNMVMQRCNLTTKKPSEFIPIPRNICHCNCAAAEKPLPGKLRSRTADHPGLSPIHLAPDLFHYAQAV